MPFDMSVLALPHLLPLIVIFGAATLQVLLEAIVPRTIRGQVQFVVSLLAIIGAVVLVVGDLVAGGPTSAGAGMIALDGPAHVTWLVLLVFAAGAVLLFAERSLYAGATVFAPQAAAVPGTVEEQEAIEAKVEHSEVFPLALYSLFGMMLFVASNNLLLLFVALEIMSLPLYLLSGLARRRRLLSQEAALKYFMLGALSSAFFLMGVALLFGYSASFNLSGIDQAIAAEIGAPALLLGGLAMLAVGMLFKVGAVPFHQWTPDVYTGAPTPVTAFMAVCTKIAAVLGLMRVFYVGLGAARWDWQPLFAVIAILTMLVGAVLAIAQTDLKRMLAYSSINHAGYLIVAIIGAAQLATGIQSGQLTSVASVIFYLVTYGLATMAAFAMITMVRDASGEVTSLAGWSGLGRTNPLFAGVFSFLMLSFAGIPLTAGFIGKWVVFAAAFRGGFAWLVVVGVLLSLVAAYFYLRVIVVMFFREPVDGPKVTVPGMGTLVVVGIGVVGTLVLGVFPGPALEFIQQAAEFIR